MKKLIREHKPLTETSFKEAAFDILKAAGTPLHYTVIARIAIECGYWRKSDWLHIKQQVYQAIKSDINTNRYGSVFTEVAPGTYEINKMVIDNC